MALIEVTDAFPKIPFSFTSLLDLENETVGSKKGTMIQSVNLFCLYPLTFWYFCIDFVGILAKIWDTEIVKGTYTKRDISVTDQSKEVVMVTLWGSSAEQFDAKLYSGLAVRKSSVSVFNGIKSLNANVGTLIWVIVSLQSSSSCSANNSRGLHFLI
jgi:hypothetical protein